MSFWAGRDGSRTATQAVTQTGVTHIRVMRRRRPVARTRAAGEGTAQAASAAGPEPASYARTMRT